MELFSQVAAIGLTLVVTYFFFRAFGPRTGSLFYSRSEKRAWDSHLKGQLGSWLVQTNVAGTLTSFATFLFLVASVKIFGWFALATALTIALSGWVTNFFTTSILADPQIADRYKNSDQVTGVIAMLFWSRSWQGVWSSTITKYISLIHIFAVIWLEFSLISEFSSITFDLDSLLFKSITFFLFLISVVYFVLRYGIRGFVFADLLHAPLIISAALAVTVIIIVVSMSSLSNFNLIEFTAPLLSIENGWLFVAHVAVLNTLQITCTEPHWFRLWLLGENEVNQQVRSVFGTAILWLIMVPVGFLVFSQTGKVGEPALVALITQINTHVPILLFIFWVGAVAAMFSTADTQFYSFLLVHQFDSKKGNIDELKFEGVRPLTMSFWISFVGTAAYGLVKWLELPFEKIIFVVVPFCITLFPAFIFKLFGRETPPIVLMLSVAGYLILTIIGFALPGHNFTATLSAVFVPVAIAGLSVLWLTIAKTKSNKTLQED